MIRFVCFGLCVMGKSVLGWVEGIVRRLLFWFGEELVKV